MTGQTDILSPLQKNGMKKILSWRWLPLLIICIAMLAPINVWRYLKLHENREAHHLVEMQAVVAQNSIAEHLDDHIMALNQLSSCWEQGTKEWCAAAKLLLAHHKELRLLARFNATQVQHELTKGDLTENVRLRRLLNHPRQQAALAQAHATKRASAWLSEDMPAMLVLTAPMQTQNSSTGSIVSIIDFSEFLSGIHRTSIPAHFGLAISAGGVDIYNSDSAASSELDPGWRQEIAWNSPAGPWSIRVWPVAEMLGRFRSWVILMPIILGPLVIILLGYAVLVAQRSLMQTEQLRKSNRHLDAILNSTHEAIFTIGMDRRILSCNRAAQTMLGRTETDMLGRTTEMFHPCEEDYQQFGKRLFPALERDGHYTDEITLKRANGELFPAIAAVTLLESEGQSLGLLVIVRDITKHKLADYDSLTGLPNRALFHERLTQAMTRSKRYSHTLAVLFLDLDDFKPVNDTHGHAVGDELLRQVALRICGCIRAEDTASRLGGDEFTVLLNTIAQPEDAAQVAQNILDAMQQPFLITGKKLGITVSIGISLFPGDGLDGKDLVHNADIAMYLAKQSGRNRYRFFGNTTGLPPVSGLAHGSEHSP